MIKTRLVTFTLASIAAAFAFAPTASAATDYFLEVDGLQGESVAVGAKDTIDIHSFSWGAQSNVTIGLSGAGSGKASFNKLSVQKRIDIATPGLFQRLAQGAPIPSVELVGRKSGSSTAFLRYCLQTVFVTSQTHSGSAGDVPMEAVEFTFGAISQNYTRQYANGTYGTGVFAGWSMMTNTLLNSSPGNCGGSRI